MNPFFLGPSSQALSQAQGASGSFGQTPLHQSGVSCPFTTKKALEVTVIEVIGPVTRPIAGQLVELTLGKASYRGVSSGAGALRFEGLDDGSYGLGLPAVDGSAWDLVRVEQLPPERVPSNAAAGWGPPAPVDLAGKRYELLDGEGVDKLGLRVGHLPETIWGHPANQAFHPMRQSRNVLQPSDQIFVPALEPRQIEARPGYHHVLIRKGTAARLRLRVEIGLDPVGGEPYLLDVPDFPTLEGNTVDGYIDRVVPAATREVRLRVKPFPRPVTIRLDRLLPLESDAGVQQRLANLGMPCWRADGLMDPRATSVLKRFQEVVKLDPSGVIDNGVRAALLQLHDRG